MMEEIKFKETFQLKGENVSFSGSISIVDDTWSSFLNWTLFWELLLYLV